jgi:cytochrome c biogenesis protein ResB
MTDNDPFPLDDRETETFPVEPRYHPVHKIPRKIYDFLASAKLAMALLVVILGCCLAGVTIVRGVRAWEVIFNALWFNALLVLLIINVACCFFGRIWHRKLTVISFGMILFHLSFVSVLGAVIYNSFFYFRGSIRLTEGETVPNGDPQSYDTIEKGRFFRFSRLKGETSLIKMHSGYKVSGEDKRAAYEVAVGEENNRKQGIIYITHKLTHRGFDYFNDKEGYSLLLMLSDRLGNELYGVHLPLQSIKQNNDDYLYSTGYRNGGEVKPDFLPFPAPPEHPRFALKVEYVPSKLKERGGVAQFKVYGLDEKGMPDYKKLIADGKTPIGEAFPAGELVISAKEVRYWVGMMVRYEPGKPIVLTSLWIGLAGMIITTLGRMFKKVPVRLVES